MLAVVVLVEALNHGQQDLDDVMLAYDLKEVLRSVLFSPHIQFTSTPRSAIHPSISSIVTLTLHIDDRLLQVAQSMSSNQPTWLE